MDFAPRAFIAPLTSLALVLGGCTGGMDDDAPDTFRAAQALTADAGTITSVIPSSVPQSSKAILTVEGTGFGTASGIPDFTMNGIQAVGNRILNPIPSAIELIRVQVTADMTAVAGPAVPFTITPVDASGLPAIEGTIEVLGAAPTIQEIITAHDQSVAANIVCSTNTGQSLMGTYLVQHDTDPDADPDLLADELEGALSDLAREMRAQINEQRDVAVDQVLATGGAGSDRRRVRRAAKGGRHTVNALRDAQIDQFATVIAD